MFQFICAIKQATQELIVQRAIADLTLGLWLPLTHGWAVSLTRSSPQTKMDDVERHWALCSSQMSVNQEKLWRSQWDYCTIKRTGEQDTASCVQCTKWHFKATLLIHQFSFANLESFNDFLFLPSPEHDCASPYFLTLNAPKSNLASLKLG